MDVFSHLLLSPVFLFYTNYFTPSTNPTGPSSGSYRVLRGGSALGPAEYCRVAYRVFSSPSISENIRGFRVCRTLSEPIVTRYTVTAQASPASGGDVRINSGTWGDSKSVTVNSGTQVTLEAAAASGYTFEGWYDGSVKVSSNTTYQVTATANKTYKANFTRNVTQYTITAQASPASGGDVRINSGTWGDSKNVTVNSGTQVTLGAAAVTGYTFEGWYDGSVKVSSNTTYQVTATANKTYKANFTQNATQYMITAQASPASGGDVRINSGTWGDSKSVTVNSGTQVTLQASAVSGYTFEGWYDGSVKVSSNTTYQVTATANKTYKANFTQNVTQYTITAQASPASGGDVRINSGTWGDDKSVTVNSGTQVTLEASAVSGYTFEGWYGGSVKVGSNTTYQVTATANKTYKANFTQNKYTITAQASPASGGDVRVNSGTWGDDKSVTVNSGTQVTLEASAVSGYGFEGWYDGSVKVGSNTTYQVTATANKTYKANFTQNVTQYTITAQASPASGGDVRINSGTWGDDKSVTVNSGTQVTLEASAVSGYGFEGWYDGSVKVGSNTTYQVTATANKTYKANFMRVTFYMGNTRDDSEGDYDEKPIHGVSLTYNYWIAPYELTFSEYDAYCEATGKTKPNPYWTARGAYPVEYVTWWGAIEYCNWLSIENGLAPAYNETTGALLDKNGDVTTDITTVEGYRLPTEAEWEYAARGGSADITNGIEANDYKYAGSNDINEVSWYSEISPGSSWGTRPVGGKKPNELGLYDMSGNVDEWCHDWWGGYPSSLQINPTGPSNGASRLGRSGNYMYSEGGYRVANRMAFSPGDYGFGLGFRLARTLF